MGIVRELIKLTSVAALLISVGCAPASPNGIPSAANRKAFGQSADDDAASRSYSPSRLNSRQASGTTSTVTSSATATTTSTADKPVAPSDVATDAPAAGSSETHPDQTNSDHRAQSGTLTLSAHSNVATGATSAKCLHLAISILQTTSPSGYRTYQRAKDKTTFNNFVGDCKDKEMFYQINVETAVHEANHGLRAESGAYHLISDEMLKVPSAKNCYAPREMANALVAQLGVKDEFFNIYVDPNSQISSTTDFTYMLDELNAYTNDYQVSVDIVKLMPLTQRQVGLPALMTFVSYYANYARTSQASTWNDLNHNPLMKSALTKLWTQAEVVLKKACLANSEVAGDDSHYIRYLCDAQQTSALSKIIGRPVACPSQCH